METLTPSKKGLNIEQLANEFNLHETIATLQRDFKCVHDFRNDDTVICGILNTNN